MVTVEYTLLYDIRHYKEYNLSVEDVKKLVERQLLEWGVWLDDVFYPPRSILCAMVLIRPNHVPVAAVSNSRVEA